MTPSHDEELPFDLTQEERAYLAPILAFCTERAKFAIPVTLTYYLNRWDRFVHNFDRHRGDSEEFANEVSVREILQRDILISAPQSLADKINAALEEPDRLYREQTSEVDQPWFGRPHESHWWWYRCPEHWAWYRDHAASAQRPPNPSS